MTKIELQNTITFLLEDLDEIARRDDGWYGLPLNSPNLYGLLRARVAECFKTPTD